jgi:hypothetical protein
MKLVTLEQVEKFLTEHPSDLLKVSENAWFSNTNVWSDQVVEDAGEDIEFHFGDEVVLRRFSGHGAAFKSTGFLHNADEALNVALAFLTLEAVFSTVDVEVEA